MSYLGNSPGVSSQRTVLEEVISGSPKSAFVPIGGYTIGYIDVLVNGVEIDSSDFTAADGVTVTLGTAAAVGDTVKMKAWLPRGLSDGYLKSEADAKFLAKTGGTVSSDIIIDSGTADGAQLILRSLGFSDWNIDNYSGRLRAYYGTTELLSLNGSGNLGLAGAPSGWGSAHKALQFGTMGAVSSDPGWARIWQNVYSDGTNYRYMANGGAGLLLMGYQGMYAYVASSGTAGNVATMNNVLGMDLSGNLSLAGNLVLANGKGIDFSATANSSGTMSSELLDDYEFGSFSVTLGGYSVQGANSSVNASSGGRYVKIGKQVTVWIYWAGIISGASTDYIVVRGLPFTVSSVSGIPETGGVVSYTSGFDMGANGRGWWLYPARNSTFALCGALTQTSVAQVNPNVTVGGWYATITYFTD